MSKYTSFPEPMEDQNPFQVSVMTHRAHVSRCQAVCDVWVSLISALCNSRRVVAHVTRVAFFFFRASLNLCPLVDLINKENINKKKTGPVLSNED